MSKLTKHSKRRRNSYWSSDSDSKEVISCSDCSTDYSSSFDIKSSHCGKDCNRKECNSSNSSESESNSIKSTEDQNFINETIEKINNNEEIFIIHSHQIIMFFIVFFQNILNIFLNKIYSFCNLLNNI